MFNQQNFDNLIDWINKNNLLLKNIYSTSSNDLIDSKDILLKAILDKNNVNIDINSDFGVCLYKTVGKKVKSLDFSFSSFFKLKSLEDKAYYLIARGDSLASNDRTALMDGLFMYAVQEQNIPITSLLYIYIEENDDFKDDYLEFLSFEQNLDGSIGIVNPLKDSFISSEQAKQWVSYNSLFVYATLPLANDKFKRR